jgi:hypothetical protein
MEHPNATLIAPMRAYRASSPIAAGDWCNRPSIGCLTTTNLGFPLLGRHYRLSDQVESVSTGLDGSLRNTRFRYRHARPGPDGAAAAPALATASPLVFAIIVGILSIGASS